MLVGLLSRLLRSLFAGLEEEEAHTGPETGDQCCPDAGAMVSEASVSVSLGELSLVTKSLAHDASQSGSLSTSPGVCSS